MAQTRPDRVLGFAHRGGMADAPENTLEAFQLALSRGCRGLESDVWLDSTGDPVLHHGPPQREKRPPLALSALFQACGTDYDLSLDMKGPGTAEATVRVAHAAGFDVHRLWLCGGSGSSAAWRQYDPDVRLVTDLRWRDAVLHAERVVPLIAEQTVDAVNLRHGRWTKRLVRVVHDAGMLAFAWDVNHSWTKHYVLRSGVDGIFSDHVDLLV
ncbi:MAG TPA: glycerophosphodiester phosphodiesterase [Mycobacteriales bacterium]|nr:glycerophosphodiester phosphodiesterase [Mycobacteriales bacterium]